MSATEKTVNESTAMAIPDPKAPIKLGVTKAALAKLKKKYSKVPDANTKEGYQFIVAAKRELTPLRTGVEAERKLQVAAAVEHQRRVNAVANEIKSTIEALEAPLYAAKKAVDDEKERIKLEAQQKEDRRIADIEAKVDEIQQLTEGLLGASLETLEARMAAANEIKITDDVYMEFVEAASVALAQAKNGLAQAVGMARQNADQQKELDEQKRKSDLEASVQRIKMAPVDLIGKPAADIEAALKKLQAINPSDYGDLSSEAIQAVLETEEKLAAMLTQQRSVEEQAVELAEQRAEQERKEAEEKADQVAAETEAAMAARLPEDQKLRAYADALVTVKVPDIKDQQLAAVARDALVELTTIKTFIYENTQGEEKA